MTSIAYRASLFSETMKRLNSSCLRVLDYLRKGPATNVELCTPAIGGLRAIGRVHDLRQAGYVITTTHVKGGVYEYRLISEPAVAA